MPFKKDLTALTKKGQIVNHKGKGSQEFPPRFSNPMQNGTFGNNTINDYAKVTPMAKPVVSPLNPGEE